MIYIAQNIDTEKALKALDDSRRFQLMCLTECEHCGKQFWYSVDVTRSYDSRPYDEDEM